MTADGARRRDRAGDAGNAPACPDGEPGSARHFNHRTWKREEAPALSSVREELAAA